MKIQNGISLVPQSPDNKVSERDAQLRQAAKMYETKFLNEMVKAMRSTVQDGDGPIKQNFAEKIFREQLDNQYVDGWADKGGIGLADMIYTQIREKYFGTGQKNMNGLKHMLPIAPQKDFKNIPSTESIQMKKVPQEEGSTLSYRFEVPDAGSSNAKFDVQAPMAGKIADVKRLDQSWNLVRLEHEDGLVSELTFPGQVTESGLGDSVVPGQRLGVLDPSRPVLAWNLERS